MTGLVFLTAVTAGKMVVSWFELKGSDGTIVWSLLSEKECHTYLKYPWLKCHAFSSLQKQQ